MNDKNMNIDKSRFIGINLLIISLANILPTSHDGFAILYIYREDIKDI
jgi:hypothetical protein